ncbi:ribonuclease R [Anoxybacter fermentans]|uniref:Ribonuclease R n=1 Tax=Anoxybacter fermentans TaxID=1323375 RepID=A0A3S9SVF0_9FIRM|nr:ribonuclease R [Anoxybacter fermentans]AZR72287.1 ribonuclease R [Anoxybacter fermentans]
MSARQTILDFMREKAYKPMSAEELLKVFEIPKKESKAFLKLLKQMEKDGEIVKTRANLYGVPERMNLVVGRLYGHPRGYGFVIPDDPDMEDLFIGPEDLNGAMHNDRVIARINKQTRGKRKEGEIIRILNRANRRIVGNFEKSRHFGFVVPDDKRITNDVFVPKEEFNGAKEGQKVVVEITRWPEKRRNPEGRIVEILGYVGDPGVDIAGIIHQLDLPLDFPKDVLKEANAISEEIPESEIKRRQDLRNLITFTIDGEDAKDFDDAVSIEQLDENTVRLGVHIADVTHYVKEGSALDQEALKRGTSIYLVDRVIPMLPKRLSNGICSLNPYEDRLTMTCMMDIDLRDGRVIKYDIFESVIRSSERLTYNQVNKMLVDNDQELRERYSRLVPYLELMEKLCLVLRKRRMERGSIDFNFPETKVKLDENGKPIDIIKVERDIAEKIIEEFMIKANEVVAEDMYWRQVPFIYRVHEEPDQQKLADFNEFIHNFGYHIKGIQNEVHPRQLQEILKKVEGTVEEHMINTVLLRSMKQAKYTTVPIGHFGLATEYYTHFTSPIRRYPDLQIHRIIKEVLKKGSLTNKRIQELEELLPEVAEHSSLQERKAMDAERDSIDLKKVEYMLDKIGHQFEGIINGVASFGFFVELENSVEGMVRVSRMTDDYYHYHEDQYALIGERTGKVYRLGDRVKVEVYRVNLEEREIDLILV